MHPMILKLDDGFKIPGESKLKGYDSQIDLISIRHAIHMPMLADKSSNSRTAGKSLHEAFTCVTRFNKASPKLLEACSNGTQLGNAQLVIVKMADSVISEVGKYELGGAFVSDFEIAPPDDAMIQSGLTEGLLVVTFLLNYTSISLTYTEYDSDGRKRGTVSCSPLTGLGA